MWAQTPSSATPPPATTSSQDSTNDLSLAVGKSVVLDLAKPVTRIVVGLGAGYRPIEFKAFAASYEDRFRTLERYVPILRSLWRGETITASGDFGVLNDAKIEIKPTNPEGPPIWLGAFGDIGIRRAARLDATWLAGPEGDDDVLLARLELYREELKRQGFSLDRDYPITRECCVAPTREAALTAARPFLQNQYESYRNWEQAQSINFDEFILKHCLVGTPDDILEKLRVYQDKLGVTEVFLRAQWMGMPIEDVIESIELLGETVLPELSRWS